MVREVIGFLGGKAIVVDMTLGAGGHAEALLSAGVGQARRRRSRSPRPRRSQVSGSPSSAIASTRSVPASPRWMRRSSTGPSTACSSTSASRRCSSIGPSAGSATGRTDRWTCGWVTTVRPPPTWSTSCPETELADLIYRVRPGDQVAPDRRRDRSRPFARADRGHRRAGRHRRGRCGTTSGGPPPRASDVPGAPHRGQPGDRGARRLPASGGRPPRSRRPRGRDRVPLARGPHREADVP